MIPVLKADDDLASCLASITRQEYPEGLIDIVVADGTEKRAAVVPAAGFRITTVRPQEVSDGTLIDIGAAAATGEIVFVVAASSGLPRVDWVRRMVKPFVERERVVAAFTQFVAAPTDNSITRYFCTAHAEPFIWFVCGDASNPRYYRHIYDVPEGGAGFTVFSFKDSNPPCVSVSYGLGFRKSLFDRPGFSFSGFLPADRMIRAGQQMAYVEGAGIYHRQFRGLSDFIGEYGIQLGEGHADPGSVVGAARLSFWRRLRSVLFWVYGLTMVLPLMDGVSMAIVGKDLCMLWHGPVTIAASWLRLMNRRGGTG